jgi:hypothetical protein
MDAVQPWVDAEEMRRLAEALMATPTAVANAVNEAGYSPEFEGFAGEVVTSAPVAVPTAEQAVAPVVPAMVAASEVRVPAPTIIEAPFTPRLRQYAEWICSRGPVMGMFILNPDGLVIFDSGDHARYHFMARSLAQAAQRQQQAHGHVQMKIGAADVLEVIAAETAIGRLVVGLIMNQSLTEGDVAMLCDSLQQVFVRSTP